MLEYLLGGFTVFDKSMIYPIFAVLVGIASIILIPKEKYKKYFIYGALFGGLGDALVVGLMSKVLHLFNYKNMGYFNVFNMFSVWTPITWAFMFSIFLYLLPVRKAFLIPYILAFVALAVGVGMTMTNFGLFAYTKPVYQYIDIAVFLSWFVITAWTFIINEKIKLK